MFMRTCKAAREIVTSFIDHSIRRFHLNAVDKLYEILNDETMPLLLDEKQIRHRLKRLEKSEDQLALLHLKVS